MLRVQGTKMSHFQTLNLGEILLECLLYIFLIAAFQPPQSEILIRNHDFSMENFNKFLRGKLAFF